jgi:hypothetical protein
MKRLSQFVLVAGLGVIAMMGTACAEPVAPLEPDAEGYLHLFNGEDLAGWWIRGNDEDFEIVDGIIRSDTGDGGQLMYYTAQEFGDFELVVEWRVAPGGNSGVFIRAPKDGWPWETAYEVQISNEQPPRDDSHCTGSLYGYTAVDPRPDETPEQWREYVITCKGPNVKVKVDGTEVVNFDQTTQENTRDKPLKGYIGVQDSHGPEGTWIEYRTIKVKPLD